MSKLLLYCTKTKPYLVKRNIFAGVEPSYFTLKENVEDRLNGKIIAECDFEVEQITPFFHWCGELENKTCLSREAVLDYLDSKDKSVGNPKRQESVNLIYIKNLHIFDKPRELSEYHNNNSSPIEKAPQNMMYAKQTVPFKKEFLVKGILQEVRGYKVNEYIIISIQPQWLCKILNGEKIIEVRKKVLKHMLRDENNI